MLSTYSKLPAYSKKDDPAPARPSFFDVLSQGVASAVFAAAHSLASLLLEYGSTQQRQQLVWKKLVPACLKVIRQFGGCLFCSQLRGCYKSGCSVAAAHVLLGAGSLLPR